jgi:hypothetical protein
MVYNVTPTPSSWNAYLANELVSKDDVDVLRHLLGFTLPGMPTMLDQAAIVCLDCGGRRNRTLQLRSALQSSLRKVNLPQRTPKVS